MRLNKYLADIGICSRREADRWIAEGRIQLNQVVITAMGTQVDPAKDRVFLDGKALPRPEQVARHYILLHKPPGLITTRSDERQRQTIYTILPEQYQILDPVGRLDKESSGALIMSNDGGFLQQIMHPKFAIEKVYRVTLRNALKSPVREIQQLTQGILLQPENKLAHMHDVVLDAPNELKLTLITGYNRQIRRSFEALGYRVDRLKRISVGPVGLQGLPPGKTRPLTKKELAALSKHF
jgi:23S rRNA pseudouridine2605 synthase